MIPAHGGLTSRLWGGAGCSAVGSRAPTGLTRESLDRQLQLLHFCSELFEFGEELWGSLGSGGSSNCGCGHFNNFVGKFSEFFETGSGTG